MEVSATLRRWLDPIAAGLTLAQLAKWLRWLPAEVDVQVGLLATECVAGSVLPRLNRSTILPLREPFTAVLPRWTTIIRRSRHRAGTVVRWTTATLLRSRSVCCL